MLQNIKNVRLCVALLLLIIFLTYLCGVDCGRSRKKGEFLAGTFILTQKSLSEAPYRYAGVLRKALDKAELKDPPSKSEEENCDVRYRIRPSGQPSKLRIKENTLSLTLKKDNTIVIGAKIDAEVTARTWIWKGIINFGSVLGCWKMSSCNGQIVTYSANIDTKVSFQAVWDKTKERLAINIKPVETTLEDVNVSGCKPPWYLSWFTGWQEVLNEGVQEAFQQFANNYQHQAEVPEEFSPFKNVFVHYFITNLEWTPDHVVFEAWATFSVLVGGKNETFTPEVLNPKGLIPLSGWNTTSPNDGESHLLQGVRLSTEFINSLMWFASISKVTEYHGSAKILDSRINGTISYDPPVIRVQENDLLTLSVRHGLLEATCKPIDSETKNDTKTLFRAEFFDLSGSGRIRLASTDDKTGIFTNWDNLDMSRMTTKPFQPKLPLPDQFEGEILKNAIAQIQPIVNQYLKEKPLTLPESIAPFAASPQLHLWKTGNGTGFAELLSYCTCDPESGSVFAKCDDRSQICSGEIDHKGASSLKRLEKERASKSLATTEGVIKSNDNMHDNSNSNPGIGMFNFTKAYFRECNQNLSYTGYYLTIFDASTNCRLEEAGASAKVYWIWQTNFCTPIYLYGKETKTYYRFLSNGSLSFECYDPKCRGCQYENIDLDVSKRQCTNLTKSTGLKQSLLAGQPRYHGQPYIYSWESTYGNTSIVANVFFTSMFCMFHPRYIEPQMLSSHINLGNEKTNGCAKTSTGQYISSQVDTDKGNNTLVIRKAHWECMDHCYGCQFQLTNVGLSNCHDYRHNIKVLFTQTIDEIKAENLTWTLTKQSTIYISVGCSIVFTVIFLIVTALIYRKNREHIKIKAITLKKLEFSDILGTLTSFKEKVAKYIAKWVGLRFLLWRKEKLSWGKRAQDLIQNVMMLANGILAFVFAEKWNEDNNPLLIIHNKFRTGFTFSENTSDISRIMETEHVVEFVDLLNFWTYLVNIINGVFAFIIVIAWIFTKAGDRGMWIKARLLNACSLLGSIFIVMAAVIFTTYFGDLVVLKTDTGSFATDNESMRNFLSSAIKISLNGVSLTVISFTIVFLFHGVGGGLFCGTVLFRLSHLQSKRQNMEVLTTLLVILTVIQPFICLHPVIIWSQDSNQNSTFLLLIILIWFLPVCVHVIAKAIISPGFQRCQSVITSQGDSSIIAPATESQETRESQALSLHHEFNINRSKRYDYVTSKVDSGIHHSKTSKATENPEKCSKRKAKFLKLVDLLVQVMQLTFFVVIFSIVTHHIVHMEFGVGEGKEDNATKVELQATEVKYKYKYKEERENLQDFVLPAIISVFIWMMSISFLLLSLVLEESREETPRLVFKDQNLDSARNLLRQSLRRRLRSMDRADGGRSMKARSLQRQCMIEAAAAPRVQDKLIAHNPGALSSVRKPVRPAPPPPPPKRQQRGKTLPNFANIENIQGTSAGAIDLNDSLRGPSVKFEAASIIQVQKSDLSAKPKLPPKPKYLDSRSKKHKISGQHLASLNSTIVSNDEDEHSNSISMRNLDHGTIDIESFSDDEDNGQVSNDNNSTSTSLHVIPSTGCWDKIKLVYHFFLETKEYKDPQTHGWRIKFRRLFLTFGIIFFTYQTIATTVNTSNYSSKKEIQKILDYAGTNLTWPDSGSVLDDVFELYNTMEKVRSYIMTASTILFWTSLALDFASYHAKTFTAKTVLFSGSRVAGFFGSLTVFASVIVVGLPDYLETSNLDEICPFCGHDFNRTVRQIAEFTIGLFFACLFTFQLIPILITVVPALVRASVLILIHPTLQVEAQRKDEIGEVSNLRMAILQQVIQFSSFLTFPITFISMAIVQQYQKDAYVTLLIVAFWTIPPFILYLGLYFSRKYHRHIILLYIYYMYNVFYVGLLFSVVLYSLTFEKILEALENLMQEPGFWAGSFSQVFLCNVVISDMLYMTVF